MTRKAGKCSLSLSTGICVVNWDTGDGFNGSLSVGDGVGVPQEGGHFSVQELVGGKGTYTIKLNTSELLYTVKKWVVTIAQ